MSGVTLFLPDEEATVAFGARLAEVTGGHGVIFLEGDLGAGKTTLSRGLIRGLGHTGPAKSPPFTVADPHETAAVRAFHFALDPLPDPELLVYLAFSANSQGAPLCLFEWPDKGAGVLPKPDLTITISPQAGGRSLNLLPQGARGQAWCTALANKIQQ
ncbi:tRNA threonylcarbamoyladenosine biosynthesis protein TsaE [Pseudomonas fluorescens]|uniref:tRNA (adenosine(37)-N6)-threonylcarbamoyltransferase complex ATPase subunit type 1 TsaE n=1 Tax=Pseudomonas fluorescens TaxID=294 RepID=UPI001242F39F|nr:tRNA (adenosine(37)-N6)-threonylcarbamoyltransferase complex ATPase subunit type 1 TsaE [Pseudomonas fluorescens]VVN29203.1 tRNA threonylcarbamoyladenosine biosynthesis protein TsaE [Pseudomonas fluorescens]